MKLKIRNRKESLSMTHQPLTSVLRRFLDKFWFMKKERGVKKAIDEPAEGRELQAGCAGKQIKTY